MTNEEMVERMMRIHKAGVCKCCDNAMRLLEAKDQACEARVREERSAFKDLVELWFLRLHSEPMQWRVEQAMKSVFGSQE